MRYDIDDYEPYDPRVDCHPELPPIGPHYCTVCDWEGDTPSYTPIRDWVPYGSTHVPMDTVDDVCCPDCGGYVEQGHRPELEDEE